MSFRYQHKKGSKFGGGIIITDRALGLKLQKKERLEKKRKKAYKERRTKTRRSP